MRARSSAADDTGQLERSDLRSIAPPPQSGCVIHPVRTLHSPGVDHHRSRAPCWPAVALIFVAALTLPGQAEPAASPDHRFSKVTVDPMKTSIYIGRVRLITGVFERDGDRFTAGYEAKVFPFFFYNETGRIAITLPEAELWRIANGEVRPFSGEAVNHRGKKRRIEGRAEPADADQGRIKIRVFVDGIELIFNGAYRFTGKKGDEPSA